MSAPPILLDSVVQEQVATALQLLEELGHCELIRSLEGSIIAVAFNVGSTREAR